MKIKYDKYELQIINNWKRSLNLRPGLFLTFRVDQQNEIKKKPAPPSIWSRSFLFWTIKTLEEITRH